MRSRALTETVLRPDVSLLVEQFRCQSHSVSNVIGANAAHRLWRVRAIGHGKEAIEIADTTNLGGAGAAVSAAATAAATDPATAGAAAATAAAAITRDLKSVTMEVISDSGVGGVKAAVMGTQVCIKADGQQLYPDRTLPKGKLHDDWMREWKFRSLYPGVGFAKPGEAWVPGTIPTEVASQVGDAAHFLQTRVGIGDSQVHTMHEVQAGRDRCPCVLTRQWPNGCFEVTAFKPDERGIMQALEFPTMHKSQIFLVSTGQPIELPELVMSLEVPRTNPSGACVYIEGDNFSNLLGRVSPKETKEPPRRIMVECPKPIILDPAKQLQQNYLGLPVQQETELIQINVAGANIFEHFLTGQVRRGDMEAGRLQKKWTVQFGPFATHTLRLVKKSHTNSVMTFLVDEEVLVECMAADLEGGDKNVFRCRFSFVGERIMDFNVFEETKDGWPLDTKSTVTKPYQYRHVVEVTYQHKAVDNLPEATLTIDGVPFERLPMILPEYEGAQPKLAISRIALEAQFGIKVPNKVRTDQDKRGVARQMAASLVQQAGGWGAIGSATQQTATDVGNSLTQFGMSAWSSIQAWQNQPTGAQAGTMNPTRSLGSDGIPADPRIQPMPNRMNPGGYNQGPQTAYGGQQYGGQQPGYGQQSGYGQQYGQNPNQRSMGGRMMCL